MSQATTLWDVVNYLTYKNPVSQAVINTTVDIAKGTHNMIVKSPPPPPPIRLSLHQYAGANYNFVRLAGISGAAAIILYGYGNRSLAKIDPEEQREAQSSFYIASGIHFVHSCALLAVPLAHYPAVTGSLMVVGTVMLSGSMYYRALTCERSLHQVATCGGYCILAAWLSLLL